MNSNDTSRLRNHRWSSRECEVHRESSDGGPRLVCPYERPRTPSRASQDRFGSLINMLAPRDASRHPQSDRRKKAPGSLSVSPSDHARLLLFAARPWNGVNPAPVNP